MKTIGLLGGLTYHATSLYYAQINGHVQSRLGGNHSARILLHSFDFAEMSGLFNSNRWEEAAQRLCDAAMHLQKGGARGIAICANLPHKMANVVEACLDKGKGVDFLHIIDFTGRAIQEKGLTRVGLLGTRPVMEEGFMKDRLKEKFGIEVVIPQKKYRLVLHELVFGELSQRIVSDNTKALFEQVVQELMDLGVEGIVLACTEFQFVLKQDNVDVPLFDTLELHARGLAEWVLHDE